MSSRPILPLFGVLVLCACTNLGLGGEPEVLTVELEAVGTDHVALVISTNWTYTQDPVCDPNAQGCPDVLRVLDADTATVAVPSRHRLLFTRDFKYFVEVFPAGGATATVKMRIDIDGEEWYNEARELRSDGVKGQETLQFVYQWQEPTIR
jgi:hypothetical protein